MAKTIVVIYILGSLDAAQSLTIPDPTTEKGGAEIDDYGREVSVTQPAPELRSQLRQLARLNAGLIPIETRRGPSIGTVLFDIGQAAALQVVRALQVTFQQSLRNLFGYGKGLTRGTMDAGKGVMGMGEGSGRWVLEDNPSSIRRKGEKRAGKGAGSGIARSGNDRHAGCAAFSSRDAGRDARGFGYKFSTKVNLAGWRAGNAARGPKFYIWPN